jgi:hypothetical protein
MYTEREEFVDVDGQVRYIVSGVDGDGHPWVGVENIDTAVEYPVMTAEQIAEALLGDA